MGQNHCSICETPLRAFALAGSGRQYYRCPLCEWIVLDEGHFLSAEEQRARYLQHENTCENAGYVAMFERFIAACIDPYCRDARTSLDFGCGPGPVLAALLRKRGFEVDTYDLFFAPDTAYQTKKYDLITSTEVFEHLHKPMEIMRELAQRISANGIIALMTQFPPDDPGLFSRWWYLNDPTHVSFYPLKTFEFMAQALHLRVLFLDKKEMCVLGRP